MARSSRGSGPMSSSWTTGRCWTRTSAGRPTSSRSSSASGRSTSPGRTATTSGSSSSCTTSNHLSRAPACRSGTAPKRSTRSSGAAWPQDDEHRERPMSERLPELSYFFPAHNDAANVRGLVAEALTTLPALADRFEIIVVDDGSTDLTASIAEELATTHPEVRVVHHPTNLGYGAALRSGFAAAQFA